jgi:organic radical activating enzyme
MIDLNLLKNKELYIYGYGVTGRWLSDNLNVKNFIDTDNKKWGNIYNGVEVKGPDILNKIKIKDSLIIVSVVDIFDVIPLLNYFGVQWIPLSESISNFEKDFENSINNTGESFDFLKYSIGTVLKCQSAYQLKDGFYLRSVDLVITEKCTLKCKDCANLMQFYEEPKTYETDFILKGVEELISKVDFINEIRVIGGEPFLNKDIYTILMQLSKIEKIHNIVIYTNGMIPPKKDEMSKISKNKIVFSVTDYGALGRNLNKTIEILNEFNFPYRLHPPEHWTDSGRILDNKLSDADTKENFAKCCGKNLYTLIGSKLYRCPFVANADQFNGIPHNINNFVMTNESKEILKKYAYGLNSIDACSFCPGRSFDSPLIKPALQVKIPIPYKKYIKIKET